MAVLDNRTQDSSNDEIKDWEQFIQNNSDSIIPKWKQFKETGSKISINPIAAVMGVFWLAYRKMYGLFCVCLFIACIFQEFIVVAIAGGFVLFLLFGDWAYYFHGQKKIGYIKQLNYSPSQYQQELKTQGGTNVGSPIFLAALLLVFIGLLIVFLSGLTSIIR